MSFQTGLSGLNAASRNLDVIGNNIANANTVGAKVARAEFSEIVAASTIAANGRTEGIGVEPASAASVAGLIKLVDEGVVSRDEKVVCICTGNVLKDPDTVMRSCAEVLKANPTAEDVRRVIA